MAKVFHILIFVFCALAISAQDNPHNTPYNNYIAISSRMEDSEFNVDEENTLGTSPEGLVVKNAEPLYKQSKQWKKYQSRRTLGWSMFGCGLGATYLGALAMARNNGNSFGGFLILAGCASTLSSIPILISAYYYRYKAKHLNFGVSAISSPNYRSDYTFTPALTLSYSF